MASLSQDLSYLSTVYQRGRLVLLKTHQGFRQVLCHSRSLFVNHRPMTWRLLSAFRHADGFVDICFVDAEAPTEQQGPTGIQETLNVATETIYNQDTQNISEYTKPPTFKQCASCIYTMYFLCLLHFFFFFFKKNI